MWTTFPLAAVFAVVCPHAVNASSLLLASSWVPTTIPESLPNPLVDPFYLVPSNLSSYSPGDVVRSRSVSTTITGASVNSYQLFYRTTDQQNKPSGTITTVWIPAVPARPAKILSYQIAEDSLGLQCAPSWSFANSSSPTESNTQNTALIIPWALSQGYYVVSSDFEGPNSAYAVGLIEGRGVLDGILAAANYLDIRKSRFEVGLLGYSGGAHATVWASSVAHAYAPELNIVGAAYGGTPIDLIAVYDYVNGGSQTAVAAGAFVGSARGLPRVNNTLYPKLTRRGREIWNTLQAPNFCLITNTTKFPGLNFSTLFTEDIFEIPFVHRTLSEQSLLSTKSPLPIPVPKFPRLTWHGLNDTVIPLAPEVEYVKQQCAKGADIRLGLFGGLNHVPNMINGIPGALLFIKQAFDKSLVKGPCGANGTFPAIGSKAALELLGEDNNLALAALLSQSIKQSNSLE